MSETPSSFSFELEVNELHDMQHWAHRYATTPAADFAVHIAFSPGQHRWFAREANVIAWWTPLPSRGPEDGVLAIPLFFIDTVTDLFTGETSVNFEVDVKNKLLVARVRDREVGIDLPNLPESPYSLEFESDRHITISAADLAHIGFVMLATPVDLTGFEFEVPLPFTSVKVESESLRVTRDWRSIDGPRVTVAVPARSDFEGTVSFFSDVLAREFFWSDVEGPEVDVVVAFSTITPNIAMLTCGNWGMRIELGFEQVFLYRHQIEQALSQAGYNITRDTRIGWDAEVRFTHGEEDVTATIIAGETVRQANVRISTLVMADAPWNLDVANEINEWNNHWKHGKLVRQGTDLFALSDFPATEMEIMLTLVKDLVETTRRVRDVIGVFIS